jgi:hypothetical protein
MNTYRNADVIATVRNILCLVPEYGILLLKKNNEKRFEAFWNQLKDRTDYDFYRNEDKIIIKSKKHIITEFLI